MRISTSYQYDSYNREIRQAQQRYFQAHREATTGKRLNTPSDDPYGTSVVLSAGGLKAASEQYTANLRSAKDYLTFTESALDESHGILREAYNIAVRANQTTVDQEARDGMANQVREMKKRLVDLGNTRGASGQYIFAGQMSNTKPFDASSGALVFSGDNNDIAVETSAAETTVVNMPGEQKFEAAWDALDQLETNLRSGTTGATDSDITNTQNQMKSFRSEWGLVGSKLTRIQEIGRHHERRIDELVGQISDIEEVDMAEAITKLQQTEVAYTAALQVGSQGFKLSLMDFIR